MLALKLLLCAVGTLAAPPLVNAPAGPIQGLEGTGFAMFLGIPYARPPVGELRWQPPVPHPVWSSPLAADNWGGNCTQQGTEDCLFLNVWTPSPLPTKPVPVLFFIHGGCYIGGSGNIPLQYLVTTASQPIIAVTTNYRMGPLGFLGGAQVQANTSDGSGGNFGIQDQRRAMQWVQENIAAFGGDPKRVMIFGESAGAGSVSTHLVAPKSWGLFHTAAIESGAFSLWNSVSQQQAQNAYDRFLKDAGCQTLECLRQLSYSAAFEKGNIQASCQWHTSFAATVDGVELKDRVWALARDGKSAPNVAVILGANRDEGSYFVPTLPRLANEAQYKQWLASTYPGFSEAVEAVYPASGPARGGYSAAWWAGMTTWTDNQMLCPAVRSAGWLSKSTKMYLYYYTHVAPGETFCAHGGELPYVLALPPANDPDGKAISKVMSSYWINLAANQDPNGQGLVQWPAFGSAGNFLTLDSSKNITAGTNLHAAQCNLWASKLEAMGVDCFPADPRWPPLCGGHESPAMSHINELLRV